MTASQLGRSRVVPGSSPLRLTKAPSGAGAISSAVVGRAYAGPFSDLRATGTTATRELALRVTHRFTRDWIQTNWTVDPPDRDRPLHRRRAVPELEGRRDFAAASITAVMKDGTSVTSARGWCRLSSVAYLWVRSERSGYVVVPASRPAGAGVHVIRPSAQSSDPKPGPTAAIQIARAQTLQPRRPRRPPHARAQRARGSRPRQRG